MFKTLQNLFDQHLQAASEPDSPFTELELASAALLVEVAFADSEFSDIERSSLTKILCQDFHISNDLVAELIDVAEQEYQESIDHYQFTKHITSSHDYPGRCELIAALWKLAYADNELDVMEEHRIRRIAELINVDHSDFIRLKIQARDQ